MSEPALFEWSMLEGASQWLWIAPDLTTLLEARKLVLKAQNLFPAIRQTVVAGVDPAPIFELEQVQPDFILAAKGDFQPIGWFQRQIATRRFQQWIGNSAGMGLIRPEGPTVDLFLEGLPNCRHADPVCLLSGAVFPSLQAGASSLAAATHYYRAMPPSALKLTIILDASTAGFDAQSAISRARQCLPAELELAERLKMTLGVTMLLAGEPDKLTMRTVRSVFPEVSQVGIKGLIGHVAYSDRVICESPCITHLVAEMGRSEALVL